MEAFIPSKAFQVLYDFEGTNDRELTVTSGEILLAQEKISEDDWMFVVKLKDSTKKGFVPAGFISELSASETTRYISAWNTDSLPGASSTSPSINRLNSTTSSTTRAYPLLSSSDKHTPPSSPTPLHSSSSSTNPLSLSALHSPSTRAASPSRVDDRFSSKRPTTPTSSTAANATSTNKNSPKVSSSSSAGPSVNAQTSVMEMFAKHEAYLRQVMKQREEKFKELEKSISSTESALDSEHGKLKQKILEEEKRVASPTFAQ